MIPVQMQRQKSSLEPSKSRSRRAEVGNACAMGDCEELVGGFFLPQGSEASSGFAMHGHTDLVDLSDVSLATTDRRID